MAFTRAPMLLRASGERAPILPRMAVSVPFLPSTFAFSSRRVCSDLAFANASANVD
jgi:hypothetical protein